MARYTTPKDKVRPRYGTVIHGQRKEKEHPAFDPAEDKATGETPGEAMTLNETPHEPSSSAKTLVVEKTSKHLKSAHRDGIVNEFISGNSANRKGNSVVEIIQALRDGLPVSELESLRNQLDLPMEKLARMLNISIATLHRRKLSGKLDAVESDRVVRFARLLGKAASVMESLENGRTWLRSPQIGLGGETPLAYAQTEVGAREVENLLGRIEYGVYS